MKFSGNNTDVVQFVADILIHFGYASPSITITTRGNSEDCSVHIVTDTLSDVTVKELAQTRSLQLINT